MRICRSLVILLLLALPACGHAVDAPFDNRGVISSPNGMLAFIGKKVSITKFDPAEDLAEGEDENDYIFMDAAYKVRYEILELVHGQIDVRFVDFKAYDHYGFPDFAETDIAMLYLVEIGGNLLLRRYQFDNVYPLANGGYAGCGDPYTRADDEDVEVDSRPLEPFDYLPRVSFTMADALVDPEDRHYHSTEELQEFDERAEALYAEPTYEQEGRKAICKMGAKPAELYRVRNERVFLPYLWDAVCEYQIESEFPDLPRLDQNDVIDVCIEKLSVLSVPFEKGSPYADADDLLSDANEAGMVSWAIEKGETVAGDNVVFLEPCLQYGAALSGGGDLEFSLLTQSQAHGLIWRADYKFEDTDDGITEFVIERLVCYQLPNAPADQGYVMQIEFVGPDMHPFLVPLQDGYVPH